MPIAQHVPENPGWTSLRLELGLPMVYDVDAAGRRVGPPRYPLGPPCRLVVFADLVESCRLMEAWGSVSLRSCSEAPPLPLLRENLAGSVRVLADRLALGP